MKKFNVILDLDNTLISSLSKDEEKPHHRYRMKYFNYHDMDGYYKVFERPGLQDFLDYLFKHFNVSVWTAASKSYALFIINKFILLNHPERKLDYILFSHHCKISNKKCNTHKALSLLKDEFNMTHYDFKNTFIIDDHPSVKKRQPANCIQIEYFDFTRRKSYQDEELKKTIPQLKYMIEKYSSL